jgi:hypothetical protein
MDLLGKTMRREGFSGGDHKKINKKPDYDARVILSAEPLEL